MEWIVAIVIGGLLWHFVIRHAVKAADDGPEPAPKPVTTSAPTFTWPELGNYEFDVVGESYHQNTLAAMAGNHGAKSAAVYTTAHIVPDANNQYDDKAMRIDIAGHPVGHLSREDARSFRRRLSSKQLGITTTSCGALIVGGHVDKVGNKMSYGVRLDIKPFDA